MNILYLGKYRARFDPIIALLANQRQGSQIVELCFGDIHIANYCRKMRLRWTGIDMNFQFVKHAQESGFEALYTDIASLKSLPQSDVCIMVGSFYHFRSNSLSMLRKIFQSTDAVIISEPVLTLSNYSGVIGFLAKRAANAGKGEEEFRYTQSSFLDMLAENSASLHFEIVSSQMHGKDFIVKLQKAQT